MSKSLTDIEFRLLKKYIEDNCGINIPEEKAYLIETRLSDILSQSGLQSFEELYYFIKNRNDITLTDKIIDAITTNETLWFRDGFPWRVLEENILPNYINKLRGGEKQKIRIWSAAASTGQEAYSTAMCIDSWLYQNNITDISLKNFEILATDISYKALEFAQKGRYDSVCINRGLDINYRDRYFRKVADIWEINEKIKNAVKFQKFNLQNSFMPLGNFDVIFCRYVLIYFSDKLREEIFYKISTCMSKEAIFFIGASELYSAMTSKYFETVLKEDRSYYIRK